MRDRHHGGALVASRPLASVLATFIAFGRHLRSTTDAAVPMGLAASLLWEWGPDLFDAMQAQAPNGNRPRRWRESVAT